MLTPVITRTNLPSIDSATKYPSIPTYHEMGERGKLTETRVNFDVPDDEEIILTEKVDGTNARVIIFPNGHFLIGSRDSLLYSKGDFIINPQLGIVNTLETMANWKDASYPDAVIVLFLEVYGHNIGKAGKIYAGNTRDTSARLFDVVSIPLKEFDDLLSLPPDKVAVWREHGGQHFMDFDTVLRYSLNLMIPYVPIVGNIPSRELPTTLEATLLFLESAIKRTKCLLYKDPAEEPAEGLVIRTNDRRFIAKMRFEDYNRTLKGHK